VRWRPWCRRRERGAWRELGWRGVEGAGVWRGRARELNFIPSLFGPPQPSEPSPPQKLTKLR
jgi:hypothetical protein